MPYSVAQIYSWKMKENSMAGSVNKVILIGNLGKDPEVRYAPDGTKIVNLTVATNESWKDKQTGERKDKTEWHRVVVFNDKLADIAEKYLKKGGKVFLEGQLQTRKWQDNSGVEKYTTEIVLPRYRGEMTLLDSRGGHSDTFEPHEDSGRLGTPSAPAAPLDFDDEIPF